MNEPLHLPDERELGEWLRGSGPDVDVAVCTRARFARNLDGHRFSTSQTAEDAKELLTMLREQLPPALDPIVQHLRVLDVSDFGPIERDLLVERHLISRELAHHPRPAAAVVDPLERVSVMLNEEDHLRLQVFRSGFDVQGAYSAAERLDDAILDALPIAFSEEFGFLTACPTNVGTGLRVSVLVHLPGTAWAGDLQQAMDTAKHLDLAVRGLYGEGSRGSGDLYQISNQLTLGRSEVELRELLEESVGGFIANERKRRQALLEGRRRTRTLRRIEEARALLDECERLDSATCLDALSALRFAAAEELRPRPTITELNRLLLFTQPAHLQRLAERTLTAEERDLLRAELVRTTLESAEADA